MGILNARSRIETTLIVTLAGAVVPRARECRDTLLFRTAVLTSVHLRLGSIVITF